MTKSHLSLLIALTMTVLASRPAFGDEPYPKNFVDFLKPGLSVGLVHQEGTADIAISIYSAEQFAIAKDARKMSLEALKARYPTVQQQVADTLLRYSEASGEAGAESKLEYIIENRTRASRVTLGIIKEIGADYVLVALLSGKGSEVLPISRISRIHLEAEGASLAGVPRIRREGTSEQ